MEFFYVLSILIILVGFGIYLIKGTPADCKVHKAMVGKVLIVVCISAGYALTLGNVVIIQASEAKINYTEWGYYFLISLFAIGFTSLFFGSKLAQDK